MRVAQIVMPGASEYERKCQRVDFAALSATHEVRVVTVDAVGDAQVAHVYATGELPPRAFRNFPVPYVASADVRRSRWPFGRAVEPGYVVSPLGEELLPEAVEEGYFGLGGRDGRRHTRKLLGTFGSKRPGVRNLVEQTLARIHRFREDVDWRLFDEVPSPDALVDVDAWVDPAIDPNDFDGFVAEAQVIGLPVVATRTPINSARLEKGRTGFLVPPSDPNEMTHAILAALFKPEVAQNRLLAARQTLSKYRPRPRMRVLTHMYEMLIS